MPWAPGQDALHMLHMLHTLHTLHTLMELLSQWPLLSPEDAILTASPTWVKTVSPTLHVLLTDRGILVLGAPPLVQDRCLEFSALP